MANPIYITRTASGVAPSSIDVGQLILDTASGYVYTKRDDNALVLINNGIPGPVGPSGAPGADGTSIINDGNRGDITVSSSGTVWVVNTGAISTSKLGGDVTPAGKALLDDANASAQRTTLGLGSAAVLNVGTGAGNVVQLDGSGKLPAVDGSQLTNLPGGGVTDGNKGDITVSGTLWTINNGVVETVNLGGDITTAGKALLDDADAAAQRATLGLAAVASTGAYSDLTGTPVIPSGTNAVAQPLGVAAAGTSNEYARGDHIHALPTAQTIGADPSGTASAAISGHVADANPHPVYPLTNTLGSAAYLNVGTVSGTVAAGDDIRFVAPSGTTGQVYTKSSGTDYDASWQTLAVSDVFVIACSDETSNLTAGTNKARFTMPYAGTLTAVKADVNTAPTGSTLVVDINEAGVSVLSTKLSIDAGETSSSTAATPAVISDSALANGAVIGIDIDQIGSTVAGAGLKVTLYVSRS